MDNHENHENAGQIPTRSRMCQMHGCFVLSGLAQTLFRSCPDREHR